MAKHPDSGKPGTERPGRARGRADVAVLVIPPDAATEQTLREAMRREGWQVAAAGQEAACAVVVWSEHSVDSDELAAAARPYLDRGKIEFYAPTLGYRPRPAIVVELAGDRGRVLRRIRGDGELPTPSRYQTTIGNRWQIVDERTGQLLRCHRRAAGPHTGHRPPSPCAAAA